MDDTGQDITATVQPTPDTGAPATPHVVDVTTGNSPAMRMVALADIDTGASQPRTQFDADDLAELAATVSLHGVLVPVRLRQHRDTVGRYEIVAGERRVRAARAAGLNEIPAIVVTVDDDQARIDALVENIQRVDLNPLEEAHAYDNLSQGGFTHEEIGSLVGKSRPHVTNTLALLKLPAPVARRVAAGVLSAGHARALVTIADPFAAVRLAERIIAEGLSVATTKELIALGDLPGAEGDLPSARKRPSVTSDAAARHADTATNLSDWLDTRVTISAGARKGRVVIEFADDDDLARLLDLLRNQPTPT